MQTTYHIKPDQVDDSLMQAIRELFKNEEALTITVSSSSELVADSQPEDETLFYSLFGSWQGQQTGQELIDQIYSARHSGSHEVNL